MPDDLQSLLGDLPEIKSEALSLTRDVTVAYAAGEVDIETYSHVLSDLRNVNCSRCEHVLWKYEVPKADGDGAIQLCHKCFWTSSSDHKGLRRRVETGDVLEFGLGAMTRELTHAFKERYDSVEYAQAGLAIVRLCAPIEQACKAILRTPGEAPRYCGKKTTAKVCFDCGSDMPD